MRFALLLVGGVMALAQNPAASVMAMLKPVAVYGHNQAWSVLLASTCSAEVSVSRAAILIEAPGILELPNDVAKVRLVQAFGHKSAWGKLADVGATMAGTGLSTAGIASKSTNQTAIGAGISVGLLLVHLLANPPDPSQFFGDLLPDVVKVPAGGGVSGFGVLSPTVDKKAKAIGPFPVVRCN